MVSTIEVFTSPTCPHCPPAKMLAQELVKEREDVKFTETSIATSNGNKRARQLNVLSVPTVFVKGPLFDRIGFRGLPSKSRLNEAIDISLGLKDWEEKKGFFEKIREKIPIRINW